LNSDKKSIVVHPGWIAVALVALTVAAYSSVGSLGFVTLDDPQYIIDNPQVSQGLKWSGVQWAFTTGHASNWHPLTWISHMVDVELFGLNPGPHHLMNLLFHVLNTLLLFLFLRQTTGATGRSALVAALFALHPLHVESVAWVSERKDVLSTLFFLLTLWAYTLYTRDPALRRYTLVFVLLALGLMAKPMLVTVPFVLLLLDIWPLQRFRLESPERGTAMKLVIEKLPLFALIVASSVITVLVQHEGGALNSLSQAPLDARIFNVLVSYVVYMVNMVWPVGLAALYPISKTIPFWQPLGAGILLVTISFGVLKFLRQYPYLTVGWLWFLGTLVPVIGIVQVGSQAMADRYTYIPLIGLFIIVAWGAYDLLVRNTTKKAPITMIIALMIVGLATATWVQVQYWADGKTLWKRALAVTSGNARAHVAYGSILAKEGHHKDAAAQFSAAIRIQPNYAEAHNKLGVEFAETGRHNEAAFHYKEALRYRSDLGMANTNLGNALLAQGRPEEALAYYEKALQQDQDDPLALNGMGSAMDDLGRVDEAIALYRKALIANPRLSAAYNNLAAAFARKGLYKEAVTELDAALEIEPENATYHYNYAVLILQQGDIEMARQHFSEALSINPAYESARKALDSIGAGKLK
jgi:tetratricopeptide (TPR) repeat protein